MPKSVHYNSRMGIFIMNVIATWPANTLKTKMNKSYEWHINKSLSANCYRGIVCSVSYINLRKMYVLWCTDLLVCNFILSTRYSFHIESIVMMENYCRTVLCAQFQCSLQHEKKKIQFFVIFCILKQSFQPEYNDCYLCLCLNLAILNK